MYVYLTPRICLVNWSGDLLAVSGRQGWQKQLFLYSTFRHKKVVKQFDRNKQFLLWRFFVVFFMPTTLALGIPWGSPRCCRFYGRIHQHHGIVRAHAHREGGGGPAQDICQPGYPARLLYHPDKVLTTYL